MIFLKCKTKYHPARQWYFLSVKPGFHEAENLYVFVVALFGTELAQIKYNLLQSILHDEISIEAFFSAEDCGRGKKTRLEAIIFRVSASK